MYAAIELQPGNVQWIEVDPSAGSPDYFASSDVSLLEHSSTSVENIADFISSASSEAALPDALLDRFGQDAFNGIGLVSAGPSVLSRYSVIPNGSISVTSPCIRNVSDFVPQDYQFTSHVRVLNSADSNVGLEARMPLASLSEKALALVFEGVDTGSSGGISLRQGKTILATGEVPNGAKFALFHAIQEPIAYGGSTEARILNDRNVGGVYVIRHAVAPVASHEFYEDLRTANTLLRDSSYTPSEKLISVLHLGTSLALQKANRNDFVINEVRGIGRATEHLLLANTRNNILVPVENSVFGYAPLSVEMDWDVTGPMYSRTGNYSDFMNYSNVANAKGELVVANSTLEGQVWNDLFGGGGTSAIKVLQDARRASAAMILGSKLSQDTSSELLASLSSNLDRERSVLQGFVQESPYLFSLTDHFEIDSIWKGSAFIIVPSTPMGQAGAYLLSEEGSPLLGGSYHNRNCDVSESDDGTIVSGSCTEGARDELTNGAFGYNEYHESRSFSSNAITMQCSLSITRTTSLCSSDLSSAQISCGVCRMVFTSHTCGGGDSDVQQTCAHWSFAGPTNPIDQLIFANQNEVGGPTNTRGGSNFKGCVAQPVNIASGTMWHEFKDFSVPARTPETALDLVRTYTAKTVRASSEFGPGWWHNWETQLLLPNPGESFCKEIEISAEAAALLAQSGFTFEFPEIYCVDVQTADLDRIVWVDENGGPWTFVRSGAGYFEGPTGLGARIYFDGNGAQLFKRDGTKLIFSGGSSSAPRGKLTSLVDTRGETVILSYGADGKLESASANLAGEIAFVRNQEGLVERIIRKRDNLEYAFTYENGRLASSSDFESNTTRYEYNSGQEGTPAHGLLSSITDPLNRKITYTYYDDGRAFEQTEPGDGHWSFFYSAQNSAKYVSVKGIDGHSTEFRLEPNGLVKEIVHPDQSRSRYSMQWNGTVVEIDEIGASNTKSFDERGNLISIQGADTSVTTFQNYTATGKPTLIQTPAGTISFEIDPQNGNVTKVQSIETGLVLDFEYDTFGNLLSTNNGRAKYSHTRNGDGLLITLYDARNPETRTYDSRNRVATRSFASGRVLTYAWDNYDRIIRVDDTAGPSLIQVWDKVGRLKEKTVTDGLTNQTTKYGWDDRDRLIEITDALNRTTKIEYDKVAIGCNVADKPSIITNSAGRKTRFFYDLRQRLVRVVDANGGVTRYDYNARNDLTGVTDPENNRTTFAYDAKRRVIKRERPSAVVGEGGNATSVTEVTNYLWDTADRLKREEKGRADSDERLVTEYEWDALSRLTKKVLKKERAGQVIEIQDEAAYTYQPQLDAGLLATANNQVANLSFEYDAVPPYAAMGYSVGSRDVLNSLNLIQDSFSIDRDVSGEVGRIKNQAGQEVLSAQYDPAGRLTKLTSGNFIGSNSLSFTKIYDVFGRPKELSSTTGLKGSFSWDALNRQIAVFWNGLDGSGSNLAITDALAFDPITGNVGSRTREHGIFTYTHDPLDQLLSVTYNGTMQLGEAVNRSWGYDYAGNRTSDGSQSIVNLLVENSSHKFVPDSIGTGSLSQKVDRASGASENFSYRADQKLVSYSKDGLVAEYFYDALGRRVAKKITKGSEPAFTQSYVHLGDEDKILLGKSGGGEITLYLDGQGIDEHLGEVSSRGAKAYATDHLGSVLNGEAAGTARAFGAWGENLNATAPEVNASRAPVLYGFTGRQLDPESQNYHYRARTFLPEVGRFAQPDPIGFAGGDTNLCAYVWNNPLKYIDPMGLWGVFAGVGGAAGGGGFGSPPTLVEGSGGIVLGSSGNGTTLGGFASTGKGTQVGGVIGAVGPFAGLIFPGFGIEDFSGSGSAFTIATPIGSATLYYNSSGVPFGGALGKGGIGWAFGSYRTNTSTQVGGVNSCGLTSAGPLSQ